MDRYNKSQAINIVSPGSELGVATDNGGRGGSELPNKTSKSDSGDENPDTPTKCAQTGPFTQVVPGECVKNNHSLHETRESQPNFLEKEHSVNSRNGTDGQQGTNTCDTSLRLISRNSEIRQNVPPNSCVTIAGETPFVAHQYLPESTKCAYPKKNGSSKISKRPILNLWDVLGSDSDEEPEEKDTNKNDGSAMTSNVVAKSDNGSQSDGESEWTTVKPAEETALKKALDAERKAFRLAEEAQQKAAEAAEAAEQIRMNQEKFVMNAGLLKKQAENNLRLNGLTEDTPVSEEVASKEQHTKKLRPLDSPMEHPFTHKLCGQWTGQTTTVLMAIKKALEGKKGKKISDEQRKEIISSVTSACQKHLFTIVKKRAKQAKHWNDNDAVNKMLYNHALKKATALLKDVKKSNHSRSRFHERVLVCLEAENIAKTLNAKHLVHTFVTEELIKKCFCHEKHCAIYPHMPTDEPSILRIQQKAACAVMAFSITPERIAESKDYYLSIGLGKDAAKAATDDLNAVRKERMKKLERAVEVAKKKKQTNQEHLLKHKQNAKERCKLQKKRAEMKKRINQSHVMKETALQENATEEDKAKKPSNQSESNLRESSRKLGNATRLIKETMPKRRGNRKSRVLRYDE